MKQFLTKIIKEAGKMILEDYQYNNSSKFTYKSGRELVTKTDLKSEKYLISALRKEFPSYNIIAEEIGKLTHFNLSFNEYIQRELDKFNNKLTSNPVEIINNKKIEYIFVLM